MSGARTSIWGLAVLGFWVMLLANVVLVVYAGLQFAQSRPDYFARAWPTFSRTLSGGNLTLYQWLAGIGGAGLICGAAAVARMRWRQVCEFPAHRKLLSTLAACAILTLPMGVVHYFHVVINLRVSGPVHMLLSYVFFFGMTLLIIVDTSCSAAMRPAAGAPSGTSRLHRRIGVGVLGSGLAFWLLFLCGDRLGRARAGVRHPVRGAGARVFSYENG